MIGEDGGNFFTERDNAFIASGRFWANNHVHIVQPKAVVAPPIIKNAPPSKP